jgi:CRISP-associated protein Cas1
MPKDLHELPKLRDSMSYLFVEHCRIEQDEISIAVWDKEGCAQVPVAALGVLMLGPGTTITHAAVRALADNGCSIVWCGEDGIRCYAQGGGETRHAYRLIKQACLMCDPAKRMEVVWRMYEKRFGYRLDEQMSLEQIRGMEGARVRDAYAEAAEEYGVEWKGRHYDRGQWDRTDPLNRALSGACACMNGVCHTAIVSGGYAPGLGFIHNGKMLSFVYDIADLYKTTITIPLAFSLAAEGLHDLDQRVRQAARLAFKGTRLLHHILPDIDGLLGVGEEAPAGAEVDFERDAAMPAELWNALFGAEGEVQDAGDDPGKGAPLAAG